MQTNPAALASFPGDITDQLPGWEFQASNPEGGMTFNELEGYYPDKGGKLTSALIPLGKSPEEGAYYRVRFEAKASQRAYECVDFLDQAGSLLADNSDVIYPGEWRSYDRVVFGTDKADSIRVFFQTKTGIRVKNLIVEAATAEAGAAYCDALYGTLPPLTFTAPTGSMAHLPKTVDALKSGKPWRVVMLGDSIVQDTFHSQFHALIKREFPVSNLHFSPSVRGGTGCWHYCQADQFKHYVLDEKPDLLIIGGISNYREGYNPTGTEAMEIVAKAAKAHLNCEVAVMSAALAVDTRKVDPDAPDADLPVQPWNYEQDAHVKGGVDLEALSAMCQRQAIPFWDMATPTYKWLYASGKPYEWYSRDFVHSGERGKQIIGRTLVEYFKTAR